jgi:hypothetical protein
MTDTNPRKKDASPQADLEMAAAPFLAFGILYCTWGVLSLLILGIMSAADYFEHGKASAGLGIMTMPRLVAVLGIAPGPGLLLVGIGLRKRWRYTLLIALPLCVLGLIDFPIGTVLFGWALYSMWKHRKWFYPFDNIAVAAP